MKYSYKPEVVEPVVVEEEKFILELNEEEVGVLLGVISKFSNISKTSDLYYAFPDYVRVKHLYKYKIIDYWGKELSSALTLKEAK